MNILKELNSKILYATGFKTVQLWQNVNFANKKNPTKTKQKVTLPKIKKEKKRSKQNKKRTKYTLMVYDAKHVITRSQVSCLKIH